MNTAPGSYDFMIPTRPCSIYLKVIDDFDFQVSWRTSKCHRPDRVLRESDLHLPGVGVIKPFLSFSLMLLAPCMSMASMHGQVFVPIKHA